MSEPIFNLGGLLLGIRTVEVLFADGSREPCEYKGLRREGRYEVFKYEGERSLIEIYLLNCGNSCALGFSAASLKSLSSEISLEIGLNAEKPSKVLSLTTHREAGKSLSGGFGYYGQIVLGREPKGPRPPDDPEYPPTLGRIDQEGYIRGISCWTYPIISGDFENIPYYSIFLLADYCGKYMALLTITDKTTTYVEPKLTLRTFSGKEAKNIELSWITVISIDGDPYMAVKQCVKTAASLIVFKPREMKRTPIFLDKIGWCSWNALLTEDLSHDNIIKIVRDLLGRGLNLGWVLIDDGWQDEMKPHRTLSRLSTNERFPKGIRGVVEELKRMGISLVGLWHTINIHWGGFTEEVSRELGIRGYPSRFERSYVPPPLMNEAFEFYNKFFLWVKDEGVDFVKVDNQWAIHMLYHRALMVGEASRNIELAMQAAAYANGLDILNCMSMVPENYSNFLFSNVMRVSTDYLPLWKADAKLHTIFSAYNALLFSNITYPDYDMFISYDPYAKVHAVARVFSGGPIYLTDREPEKTNIDLLKRFVLPDGRVIKVDEPALPTRDILFRDPYNDLVLLKLASKVKESIAIAAFNVNRRGERIDDSISLDILPFNVRRGNYIYYNAFKDERGILRSGETLKLSLEDSEVEVISLIPVDNDRAVIGLKEYILPHFPIKIYNLIDGTTIVETSAQGTLLYYANGSFNEVKVRESSIIKI
ncbi:MAG: Sip1-related alpha-galactosidase [Candidatus Bathyarchaeia archaeon]